MAAHAASGPLQPPACDPVKVWAQLGGLAGLLALSAGDGGQVGPYLRRTRLPDTKPYPNSTHRGNAIRAEVFGEQMRCVLPQRSGNLRHARDFRRRLRAADDHHEEFVRADEGDRRPRGHVFPHQSARVLV